MIIVLKLIEIFSNAKIEQNNNGHSVTKILQSCVNRKNTLNYMENIGGNLQQTGVRRVNELKTFRNYLQSKISPLDIPK